MYKYKGVLLLIVLLLISFGFYILDFKVCLFNLIFNIPCPGCGLTTSIVSILSGNIIESFSYNILGVPIVVSCIFYLFIVFFNKEVVLKSLLTKYKKILISLSVITLIISWGINLIRHFY